MSKVHDKQEKSRRLAEAEDQGKRELAAYVLEKVWHRLKGSGGVQKQS